MNRLTARPLPQPQSAVSTPTGLSGRYLYRLMASLAVCAASIGSPNAADVREGSVLGEVVLEGIIETGDYAKVESFFEDNLVRSIYLASPGGHLIDAIKIGRLVRALKLETIVPNDTRSDLREKLAARHKLNNANANYMCASACFFVFAAGVKRTVDFIGNPLLGIHRPYWSDNDLRALSDNQAIASANQLREVVEKYLREMSVPAKYADLMFSVPKDRVRWITGADFEVDLEGFIPELKDWMDARCDTRTDAERAMWEEIKDKSPARMTTAEKSIADMIRKKMTETDTCQTKTLSGLSHQAHLKMFWEPRKAAFCSDDRSEDYSNAKLAAAVPNEASAATLLTAVQNAALCSKDQAARRKVIRALAERGDAGAQLILGSTYYYSTTTPDKSEGVKWFRRAADQGNTEAQGQLSSIYSSGHGVPLNYVEALKWMTLLISRNNEKALIPVRNSIASKMTPEQIAETERLASEWRPAPERDTLASPIIGPEKDRPQWWQFWKR